MAWNKKHNLYSALVYLARKYKDMIGHMTGAIFEYEILGTLKIISTFNINKHLHSLGWTNQWFIPIHVRLISWQVSISWCKSVQSIKGRGSLYIILFSNVINEKSDQNKLCIFQLQWWRKSMDKMYKLKYVWNVIVSILYYKEIPL